MTSSSLCACGRDRKPIGKCYRCGALVCERCVAFLAGKAVCASCAAGHEHTIVSEIQRGRTVNIQLADSAVPTDDLVLKRRQQLRKLFLTLRKCSENAVFIMIVVGVLLLVVFFSHVLDVCAYYAIQVEDTRNPLARLTIRVAARTDMLYLRYTPAIGLYTRYMDKYPDSRDIPVYWYRIGMCYFYNKEYRAARQYLSDFCTKWPEHALKRDALEQISTIDGILAVIDAAEGKVPETPPK